MLSPGLKDLIQRRLKGDLQRTTPISGGSINNAYQLLIDGKSYFLKTNKARLYPGMFEAEARGLELLGKASVLRVPEVFYTGVEGNDSYILMTWLEAGARRKDFHTNFGKGLAKLHRHSSGNFGLDHSNYIGSLVQSNTFNPDWTSFFIEERLFPQLEMALGKSALPSGASGLFNAFFRELPSVFPKEKPALLHGDLWSGNYITGPDGAAAIIDPAVYYGHREMDIAMSRLFGGFGSEFYESYNDEFPLEKGWETRVQVCNLYPLLVHVNLFEGGYASQVMDIVRNFKA